MHQPSFHDGLYVVVGRADETTCHEIEQMSSSS
jgi:hypothetical protein